MVMILKQAKMKKLPVQLMSSLLTALILVSVMLFPAVTDVEAAIPLISIVKVEADTQVTIQATNFPANTDFKVMMGVYGTLGVNGTVIETINTGAGGSFQDTYLIPEALKGSEKIAIRLESTTGYYSYDWFVNVPSGAGSVVDENASYTGIPTTSIVSVDAGNTVTIKLYNYPKNIDFNVRMGLYGTLGVGGELVASFNSGNGGTMEKTFDIPESLKDDAKIAIRLEGGIYYSYDWFNNPVVEGGGPASTSTVDPNLYYTGIPTIDIVSVDPGVSVTIKTTNFPKQIDFNVRMGAYGTLGVSGELVATFNSADGGSFEKTFTIPEALKDYNSIAIRTESTNGVYFSYDWFVNIAGGTVPEGAGSTTPGVTYTGIPATSIVSVVKDSTVTIKLINYPANVDFTVRMGDYGTLGVGGEVVDTINSGTGGTFEKTFNIPASQQGKERVAIRLDGAGGVYYSYDWFYNK
jgi:hypothetical protein